MEIRVDDMPFYGIEYNVDELEGDAIDNVIDEYNLMGYDDLPVEYMGGIFKKLFTRIRDRIRARKAARKAAGQPASYGLSTPAGSVQLGPEGLNITPSGGGAGIQAGLLPVQQQTTQAGIMGMVQKNPMLLMIPLALFALLTMKKGKK